MQWHSRLMKAVFDRLVALVALVCLIPVLALIAAWILLDDRRPVLFVQNRVGKDAQPFRMFKFRTMVRSAPQLGLELGITKDPFGIVADDPRITSSGAFLRRTSLDELPQLLNVLLGRMSLVGPRPDVVEQVAHYSESERLRLAVKPGITGWAQVNGRDDIPWPVRFKLDQWYIDQWSFALDLRILLRTLRRIARREATALPDEMNIDRRRRRASDGGRTGGKGA